MSAVSSLVPKYLNARLWVGLLVLLLTGVSAVSAQELVQADGRLNQVTHFGGDAVYCVDANFNVTDDYPASGGFRLLNSNGQVLWFVPAEQIDAAVAQSVATGEAVLVGEGQGTYGPVRLDTYFDGKTQVFVFGGYDEFGKTNSLTYELCTPVGPVPEPPGEGESEELCTLVTYNVKKLFHAKAVTPVLGALDATHTPVPCDQCPPFAYGKLVGKRFQPVQVLPPPHCLEDEPV